MTHDDLQACIELCWECRTVCQETLFNHCLQKGDEHVDAAHVSLMADCIQMCQTAADFMVRKSELYVGVCAVAANVCDACAASCEELADPLMKKCADICRRCAESCRTMGRMKSAA